MGAAKSKVMTLTDLPPAIAKITRQVAAELSIDPDTIFDGQRFESQSKARKIIYFLARERHGFSFPELGRMVGGVNHSTIMSAVACVERVLSGLPSGKRDVRDFEIKEVVMRLRERASKPGPSLEELQTAQAVERSAVERALEHLSPTMRELAVGLAEREHEAMDALSRLMLADTHEEAWRAFSMLERAAKDVAMHGPMVRHAMKRAAELAPQTFIAIDASAEWPVRDVCCPLADLVPGRRCPVHAPLDPSTESDPDPGRGQV